MRSFSIIQVGPKSRDKCPYKSKSEGDHTDTEEKAMGRRRQRLERCGHKQGNAKDGQGLPKVALRHEMCSSPEPLAGTQPCRHLHLGLPASRTARGQMSVVLSHHICGGLLWRPQGMVQSPTGRNYFGSC